MRMWRLLLVSIGLSVTSPVFAAPGYHLGPGGNFGLGLGLGGPTGVTGKYFLSSDMAIDFGLDLGGGGFGVHSDFLFHFAPLTANRDVILQFYVGPGVALGYDYHPFYWSDHHYHHANFAIRAPFGLDLWLRRAPFEFFLEIGPELWLDGPWADLLATIGFRYYF